MTTANPGYSSTAPRPGLRSRLTENTLAGMARRRMLMAYLFLIPTMVGIFIFTAGPVMISLTLSVFHWDIFSPPEFVGLENFNRFFSDAQVLTSFGNTLRFVVFDVALQVSLALLLALAVQRRMHWLARYYFRTAFFLPLLMSAAAVSVSFGYLFHREFGVVNYYLGFLGVSRIPWLVSKDWVLVTIILTAVWRNFGFTFIVFLGGITNISREVLEAADVDGAHGWIRLRRIILPLLSPTILFAMVTAVIGAIQVFEEPYIMAHGGRAMPAGQP